MRCFKICWNFAWHNCRFLYNLLGLYYLLLRWKFLVVFRCILWLWPLCYSWYNRGGFQFLLNALKIWLIDKYFASGAIIVEIFSITCCKVSYALVIVVVVLSSTRYSCIKLSLGYTSTVSFFIYIVVIITFCIIILSPSLPSLAIWMRTFMFLLLNVFLSLCALYGHVDIFWLWHFEITDGVLSKIFIICLFRFGLKK